MRYTEEKPSDILDRSYNAFLKDLGFDTEDNVLVTHDGYPLTPKEAKFIDIFVVKGQVGPALREAGCGDSVLHKDYIQDEIKWRFSQLEKQTIADADEVMQYFTSVMRGEIKDQFGLDAPLGERTSAARELAKRLIDMPQQADMDREKEVKITLNWSRE